MRHAASFLTELILIREGKLQLHNNDSCLLSHDEIDDILARYNLPLKFSIYIWFYVMYLVYD